MDEVIRPPVCERHGQRFCGRLLLRLSFPTAQDFVLGKEEIYDAARACSILAIEAPIFSSHIRNFIDAMKSELDSPITSLMALVLPLHMLTCHPSGATLCGRGAWTPALVSGVDESEQNGSQSIDT